MKVLRITRHAASPDQVNYLRQVYGSDVEIVQKDIDIQNAGQILKLAIAESATAIEVVLPFEMLADVVPLMAAIGVQVIRAKMVRNREAQTMEFGWYELLQEVVLKTERLEPLVRLASPATSPPTVQ